MLARALTRICEQKQAELWGEFLRRTVGLRLKPERGVSYRDTLFQRPEQVEDDYYRFRNKTR